jgi:hypothetical protein
MIVFTGKEEMSHISSIFSSFLQKVLFSGGYNILTQIFDKVRMIRSNPRSLVNIVRNTFQSPLVLCIVVIVVEELRCCMNIEV